MTDIIDLWQRVNRLETANGDIGVEILTEAIDAAVKEERHRWRYAAANGNIRLMPPADDCEECPHGGRTLSCPECCIQRVREEEREACAKIADAHKIRTDHQTEENDWGRNEAAVEIADAIRRRGQS